MDHVKIIIRTFRLLLLVNYSTIIFENHEPHMRPNKLTKTAIKKHKESEIDSNKRIDKKNNIEHRYVKTFRIRNFDTKRNDRRRQTRAWKKIEKSLKKIRKNLKRTDKNLII